MDHGQGPRAARGSEKRQRHRSREDSRPACQEEWSTGKVGVTAKHAFWHFCSSPPFLYYPKSFSRFQFFARVVLLSTSAIFTADISRPESSTRRRLAHSIIEPLPHVVLVSTCSYSRVSPIRLCASKDSSTYVMFPFGFHNFLSAAGDEETHARSRLNKLPR